MSMVDLYFPPSAGVSIIAEPGSFFVSAAFTLAVNVISKEAVARDCQDHEHGQWHNIHTNKQTLMHIYRGGKVQTIQLFTSQTNT